MAANEELLEDGPISLDAITDEFRKKYIQRALEVTAGNKTEAANLLGYKNYQTLTNEMKRMGLTAAEK